MVRGFFLCACVFKLKLTDCWCSVCRVKGVKNELTAEPVLLKVVAQLEAGYESVQNHKRCGRDTTNHRNTLVVVTL